MSDKIKSGVLYGAIIGDIVGSLYEHNRIKTKDFDFFGRSCCFTDDTVMTIAVADALLSCYGLSERVTGSEESVKEAVTEKMQCWGRKYPHAGYGHGFKGWLKADNPHPYKSFGNGEAMRVSAVALLEHVSNHFDFVRDVARWTAEVTHNNKEAVKSVEAVASAIRLAQRGKSKAEIKSYLESEFGYDLSRTLDEIRSTYDFEVSAEKSVPKEFKIKARQKLPRDMLVVLDKFNQVAVIEAGISGSIAEAFYGVPKEFKRVADLQDELPELCGNDDIVFNIAYFRETIIPEDAVDMFPVLKVISQQSQAGQCFIVPMETTRS